MLSSVARDDLSTHRQKDAVGQAIERLESALPRRTDSTVLMELLEDDLREGLAAISEVEAHFTEVLDTLRKGALHARGLLEVADDVRVLQQVDVLHRTVSHVRRRLSQAAGRVMGSGLR